MKPTEQMDARPRGPAVKERRRPSRRDPSESARIRGRSARTVSYEIAGAVGCGLVAEAGDASQAYGGDLVRRARELDRELLQLARQDSAARRVLGRLAHRFDDVRGFERLGFARLADYSAERLGWSGGQLQNLARVAGALAKLPEIEKAFTCGALGWSKVRILACIATPTDEAEWLAVAAATDVRSLVAVTSSARAASREQRRLASGGTARTDPEAVDDEDAEERVLLRIPCSLRTKRLWNDARRFAPRMAGRALAQCEVAELVAGEGSSAPSPFHELWQREPWRSLASTQTHSAQRQTRATQNAEVRGIDPWPQDSNGPDEITSPFEHELAGLDDLDAFGLDAAMRRVRCAMQQRQYRYGVALGTFVDLRLQGPLGYSCAADYIRDRLGMSERTARDLVRVVQVAQRRSSLLASAYAAGELSPLQVLTLLAVARPWNAAAWVKRAGEVTLRRLADEVTWAAERAELNPKYAAAMPPDLEQHLDPLDDRQMCARDRASDQALAHDGDGDGDGEDDDRQLCAGDRLADEIPGHASDGDSEDDDRQMCARDRASDQAPNHHDDQLWGITGRIHVTFAVPLSVSVLLRTVMQGFAGPTEPRWKGFERLLEQVLDQWHSQPRHRDPVFERNGYRCTTPACRRSSTVTE